MLSKEDIIDILNACSDIRLKTYVMMLAATGMRATEALSIRIKDLDLESQSARLFVRGEYTKTRVDRTVFLTEEIAQELEEHMSQEQRYLEYEVVLKAITKDIEQAYNHTRNHIRVQGEILKLDADCEYCKVYFEEHRILKIEAPYAD